MHAPHYQGEESVRSLARSILNWNPGVTLDAGIELTAKYFAKELAV